MPEEKHNVILYSTEYCPYCHMAAEFLKQNNIEFTEYKVDKDKEKAMEMIIKSGQKGVPVIEIDGNIVIGFNVPRIRELLGL